VASFPYFNGIGSVWHVSVNQQNSEEWVHVAVSAGASLLRRFTDTNVYETGSVKIGPMENSAQDIRGNADKLEFHDADTDTDMDILARK